MDIHNLTEICPKRSAVRINCFHYSKKSDNLYQNRKTLIEVHKEGKYVVAMDLLTNVADQGSSEEEAFQNLKKGLEEHYQLQIELTPCRQDII